MIIYVFTLACLYLTYYCLHFCYLLNKQKNYLALLGVLMINISIIFFTVSLVIVHYL